MNKKTALFVATGLIVIALVFGAYWVSSVKDESEYVKTEIEKFYEPMHLNDSLIHINLCYESCALIGVDTNSVFVQANNIENVSYGDNTHVIGLFCHGDPKFMIQGKWFSTLYYIEIDLDTVLKVHNNQLDNISITYN
jgi:hypothetical protein